MNFFHACRPLSHRKRLGALVLLALGVLPAAEPTAAVDARAVTKAFQDTGLPTGLVVVAGAENADQVASLGSATGPVLVLARAAEADGIRSDLAKRNLLGRITVETLTDPARIPLAQDSAAALVILPGCTANADERLRVVRPGGRVLASGPAVVKPWLNTYAGWGQMAYDATNSDVSADRAVGPSRSLQWSASDGMLSTNKFGLRAAEGILVGTEGTALVGRDAFSGLCLWRRDDVQVVNPYAFVAAAGRVLVRPVKQKYQRAIDLMTGKDLITYDQGADFSKEADHDGKGNTNGTPWARTVVADGVLIQTAQQQLCALDLATGAKLWSKSGDGRSWGLPTVLGSQVVVAVGAKTGPAHSYLPGWSAQQVEELQTFDLRTGKPGWTWAWSATKDPMYALHLAGDARGYIAISGHVAPGVRNSESGHWLTLLDGQGKQRWQRHLSDYSKGHGSNYRVLIHRDIVWYTGLRAVRPMALADGADLIPNPNQGERWLGICISWCQPVRMANDLLVTMLFATEPDPLKGRTWRNDAARSSCDVGGFPAFGRIYTTATGCGCQSFLPGLHAFDSTEPPTTAPPRLAKAGPGRAAAAASEPDAWPQLARDAQRSRWSSVVVADQLSQRWVWKAADPLQGLPPTLAADWREQPSRSGPITAPVLAEGLAVVAITDQHTVVALDAASGAVRWQATVPGRVDAPPVIHAGLVLVGTRSGWVVALSRTDGQEVWRFQAAPAERLILSNGQVESAWPVPGVTVHKGLVWCAAGRHSQADGGLWWWALQPGDGKVVHQGRLEFGQRWFNPDELRKLDGGNAGAVGAMGLQRISLNSPFIAQEDDRLLMWDIGLSATGAAVPVDGNHGARARGSRELRPGKFGLLQNGRERSGMYGAGMSLGGVKGKLIAHQGDDFVVLFSNYGGEIPDRGGDPTTVQAWKMVGGPSVREVVGAQGISKLVWDGTDPRLPNASKKAPNAKHRRDHDESQALAVAGNRVVLNHGLKLLIADRADGVVKGECALPAIPVHSGVAVANGLVVVACADGSVVAYR